MKRLIAYYRVSTRKQEASGLGLTAQRQAVEQYASTSGGVIAKEFQEIETGTKKGNDRPKLQEALDYARLVGGRLVIAKLDRLSRSVAFITALMESGADFVACDNPQATPLTIQILAVLAEQEAKMISERTKAALARSPKKAGRASPDYGTGPNTLPESERSRRILEGSQRGNRVSAESRTKRACQHRGAVRGIAQEYRKQGLTLREVAARLNAEGITTTRGGQWHAASLIPVLGEGK